MQGVINFKGKNYMMVAERVRLAHETRDSFEMVESGPLQVGDMVVWQVVILVNGKRFIGTAEIKFDASPKTADGTNPVACAETSAVGRALGMAGIGSVDSIASADEVAQAIAEQSRPPRPSVDPDGPASDQQIATIKKLQKAQGLAESDLDGICWADAAEMLRSLQQRQKAS